MDDQGDVVDNIQRWIEIIIGETIEETDFLTALKTGRYLCLLIIKLYKGLGMKQQALAITISEDESERNIQTFLKYAIDLPRRRTILIYIHISACVTFGVAPEECFHVKHLSLRDEFHAIAENGTVQYSVQKDQ